MDSSDLATFAAVARAGGITRAARELHTVQSNVTARIRGLERGLGVALFDRHARGVTLTEAGRALLPYAEQVTRLVAEARRAVTDDATPRGPLEIGSLETTAALRLPPIVAAYCAAYPEVDLRLRTGTTGELLDSVLARRVEGAFVAGPVTHPELNARPVVTEQLVLVTPPHVESADALAADEVKILVLRAGCSYRERLEHLLGARGVRPSRLEFGMIDGIVGCVAAGLGITLLPRVVAAPFAAAGSVAIHALPAADALVTTLFVRRRDAFTSSALARFVDALPSPESFEPESASSPRSEGATADRSDGVGAPAAARRTSVAVA